jgi:hypothetical protein
VGWCSGLWDAGDAVSLKNGRLEELFGLLGWGVVGKEVEEVVEVGDGHFEIFDGGSEAVGVEAVALLWVGGGEVVEGEVEGVWGADRAFAGAWFRSAVDVFLWK